MIKLVSSAKNKLVLSLTIIGFINCSSIDNSILKEKKITYTLLKDSLQSVKNKKSTDSIIITNISKDLIALSYFDKFSDLVSIKILPNQTFVLNSSDPVWLINTHYKHGTVYLLKPGDSISAGFDNEKDIKLSTSNISKRKKEIDIFRYINSKFNLSYYQLMFSNNDPTKQKNEFESRVNLFKDRLLQTIKLLNQYVYDNNIDAKFASCASHIAKLEYYSKSLMGLWNFKSLSNIACHSKEKFDSLYSSLKSDSLSYICSPIPYRNVEYSYFVRNVQFQIGQNPFEKSDYQIPLADTLYNFALKDIRKQEQLDNFLFLIVKNELLKFPRSSQNCLKRFFTDCKNEQYKRYVGEMITVNNINDTTNSNDTFLNSKKAKFSFAEILKSFKGNIVYMDIWASWCTPCRAEFPYALELRAKYRNKPIKFVYISIDNNYYLWNKAIKQENLTDFPTNYLLLDFENSLFKQKFKLGPIPRYIIFDKAGNVINAEAPRPSDKSLSKIVDQLIREAY